MAFYFTFTVQVSTGFDEKSSRRHRKPGLRAELGKKRFFWGAAVSLWGPLGELASGPDV